MHIEAQDVVPEVPLTVNNISDAEYFKMFGLKRTGFSKSLATLLRLMPSIVKQKWLKSSMAVTIMAAPSATPSAMKGIGKPANED